MSTTRDKEDATCLDDNLHEVLLSNHVFTVDDLLKNGGEDAALVHVEVDAVELGEADEVRTDEDSEVAALHFALVAVAGVALVLETDPEFVHLDKVCEDKGYRI